MPYPPTQKSPPQQPITPDRRGVHFGCIWEDALTCQEAMSALYQTEAGELGGSISAPNVDPVVQAEKSSEVGGAHDRASLGLGIVWHSASAARRIHASAAPKV